MYRVWTDGSGIATGSNHTGLGVVLQQGSETNTVWEVHVGFSAGHGTHNVAELKAIALGVRLPFPGSRPLVQRLKDCAPLCSFFDTYIGKKREPITVISDSEYALGSISGRFNGTKNLQVIRFCKEQTKSWERIEYTHVRGHANQRENEIADDLAGKARMSGVEGNGTGFTTFDVYLLGEKVMAFGQPEDKHNRWELTARLRS